jgi:hypothetical protein
MRPNLLESRFFDRPGGLIGGMSSSAARKLKTALIAAISLWMVFGAASSFCRIRMYFTSSRGPIALTELFLKWGLSWFLKTCLCLRTV